SGKKRSRSPSDKDNDDENGEDTMTRDDNQPLDILIGFNSDEGSLILNSLDERKFPRYSPNLTVEDGRNWLLETFSERFGVPPQIVRTALPSYLPEGLENNS